MKLITDDKLQALSQSQPSASNNIAIVEDAVKQLTDKLVQTPNSTIRRAYITVSEKIILYLKSKVSKLIQFNPF